MFPWLDGYIRCGDRINDIFSGRSFSGGSSPKFYPNKPCKPDKNVL